MAPSGVKRKRPDANTVVTTQKLRDISTTKRHFWKDDLRAQFALCGIVRDQNTDYETKDLVSCELTTMALQEVAVEKEHGFFFHLPSVEQWKKNASEDRLPSARAPQGPGYVSQRALCSSTPPLTIATVRHIRLCYS